MKKRYVLLAALLALFLFIGAAQAEPPQIDANDWMNTLTDLVEQTGNRESFSENEGRAAAYLTRVWEAQGYTLADGTLQLQNIPSPWEVAYETGWEDGVYNLIATKKALYDDPPVIIVCAHYDTFYNTVGAKDNGSGVAAMLTLSKAFAAMEPYKNTELRFIAFAGEEYDDVGSAGYVDSLTTAEARRVLAVFNIDLIAVEEGAANIALCCNTLGGRRSDGSYLAGGDGAPVDNSVSIAFSKAFWALGGFTEQQRDVDFCLPRHWGEGDHTAFHNAYIDAATICFQGNVSVGGAWPADMHAPEDNLDKQFDMGRTQHALNVLALAIDSLATEHEYGDVAE